MGDDPRFVKIHFALEPDEYGYPPVGGESLWAIDLGNALYQIDNVPFFARLVGVGDVVRVGDDECGNITYFEHHSYSRHSTFRIMIYDRDSIPGIRESIALLKGSSEYLSQFNVVAIDVPKEGDVKTLLGFLKAGENRGDWTFEEALIWY